MRNTSYGLRDLSKFWGHVFWQHIIVKIRLNSNSHLYQQQENHPVLLSTNFTSRYTWICRVFIASRLKLKLALVPIANIFFQEAPYFICNSYIQDSGFVGGGREVQKCPEQLEMLLGLLPDVCMMQNLKLGDIPCYGHMHLICKFHFPSHHASNLYSV